MLIYFRLLKMPNPNPQFLKTTINLTPCICVFAQSYDDLELPYNTKC